MSFSYRISLCEATLVENIDFYIIGNNEKVFITSSLILLSEGERTNQIAHMHKQQRSILLRREMKVISSRFSDNFVSLEFCVIKRSLTSR